MMHILICEDDIGQRTHIESIVKKTITTEDFKMKLILSSGNPMDVLAYLKAYPDKRGLYFLDIDLQHNELDGIKLGKIIRETDPLAKIVFITTHSELAHLTFQHKLSAMDYIVKGSPKEVEMQIIECILLAHERYLEKKSELMRHFTLNANGEVWNIPYSDILFFETHPKITERMILHMTNSEIDFRGTIGKIAALVPEFYRCHKSFLVNPEQILRVDKVMRQAEMTDGSFVHIAAKKMSTLMGMIRKE